MEYTITAHRDGIVNDVYFVQNEEGVILLVIEYLTN